jgi:putative membrane-bound dehydrogenase-like protein
MHIKIRSVLALSAFLSVFFFKPYVNGAEPAGTGTSKTNDGWISLFNGQDLSGWHLVLTPDKKGVDPEKVFQVHGGVIHVYRDVPQGAAVPIGYIVSDDAYSSYHLKLQFRWVGKRFAPRVARPRDAGVLYHASPEQKVWPRSIECQIQEGDVGDCYTVNGVQVETTCDPVRLKSGEHRYMSADNGGVADVWGGPRIARIVKSSTHENDGWNTVEVIVRGDEETIHRVNGRDVFRATKLRQLDPSGKNWIPLNSGRILLQAEYAEVEYRDVQIKPLEGKPFRIEGHDKPKDSTHAAANAAPPAIKQAAISPAENGVFSLSSKTAALNGKSVQRQTNAEVLENWRDNRDRADWDVSNSKMGDYDVAVTWSVAEVDAPQGYGITIDHRATIRAFTVSTKGTLKREIVGRIMLPPGIHTVSFSPSGRTKVRGGLCKLKQIELVPVANLATVEPQEPVELHVPKGFEVERIAAPPLTSHPMLACFDDRGRLYVCESTGVNADAAVLAESPPHDIRLLEDTDADGHFDKVTIFADKMTIPQGVLWHNGSVYTSSPPNFWRLTDTDGDGVADKREILATGFPFRGMSDDMHGASLGPDGRIYFASGRMQHSIHRPGGPIIQQGYNPVLVRCRPDGSQLEFFSGAMGNAVGVAFTDAGDCFASGTFGVNAEGKRDSLNHSVEGGAYPVRGQSLVDHKLTGGEMPNLAEFGVSANSDLMIYRDAAFGSEFRGNLFSAMFNLHKIARHVLEPDGATYRCHTEDFITSPNPDFHATDVLEDADGSLIVLDTGAWFLIGCPTSVIAKPQISGGIYRIRRSGAKPIADPWGTKLDWDTASMETLVARLNDTRFAVRDHAMRSLAAHNENGIAALQGALSSDSPVTRLNAVWTLSRIDDPKAATAARTALGDSDDDVRKAAVMAAGLFRDHEALPKLLQIVGTDKSSPVRREAATSLGRIGDKAAVPALLSSLAGVTDRFLEHAAIYATIRLDDREQTAARLSDKSPEVRRAALVALDQMDHGRLTQDDVTQALQTDNARVQRSALEIITRHKGWANQITRLSTNWIANPDLSEDRRSALRGVLLAFAKDRAVQQLVAQSLASDKTPQWATLLLLDVIARSDLGSLPHLWEQPLLTALRSKNVETERAAVTAIAQVNQSAGKQQALGRTELLDLAGDNNQPLDLRVSAIVAANLVGQPIPPKLFDLLVDESRPSIEPVTRLQAASALGSAKLDASQLRRLIELIGEAGPLEMPALMRAVENSDVRPVARQLVQSLGKSPGLSTLPADRLLKVLETLPTEIRPEADSLLKKTNIDLAGQRKRLEELKDCLVGGDSERGKALFFGTKASCSACHRIGDEGGQIGPNLIGIGEIRTRRDLLEAITFPSASFARNFEPYTVITKSGVIHAGIISRTTNDALYVTTTERTTIRIPRAEIEEDGVMPSKVSIMPQGLDRLLQPNELRDLLAFLSSQRDPKSTLDLPH